MFFAIDAEAIKSIGLPAKDIAANDAVIPFMILPAGGSTGSTSRTKIGHGSLSFLNLNCRPIRQPDIRA